MGLLAFLEEVIMCGRGRGNWGEKDLGEWEGIAEKIMFFIFILK